MHVRLGVLITQMHMLQRKYIMVAKRFQNFVLLLSPKSPRHQARINAAKCFWRYLLGCWKDAPARCPKVHCPSPSSLEWTGPGAHNKNCTNTVLCNCWFITSRYVVLQCLANKSNAEFWPQRRSFWAIISQIMNSHAEQGMIGICPPCNGQSLLTTVLGCFVLSYFCIYKNKTKCWIHLLANLVDLKISTRTIYPKHLRGLFEYHQEAARCTPRTLTKTTTLIDRTALGLYAAILWRTATTLKTGIHNYGSGNYVCLHRI